MHNNYVGYTNMYRYQCELRTINELKEDNKASLHLQCYVRQTYYVHVREMKLKQTNVNQRS